MQGVFIYEWSKSVDTEPAMQTGFQPTAYIQRDLSNNIRYRNEDFKKKNILQPFKSCFSASAVGLTLDIWAEITPHFTPKSEVVLRSPEPQPRDFDV